MARTPMLPHPPLPCSLPRSPPQDDRDRGRGLHEKAPPSPMPRTGMIHPTWPPGHLAARPPGLPHLQPQPQPQPHRRTAAPPHRRTTASASASASPPGQRHMSLHVPTATGTTGEREEARCPRDQMRTQRESRTRPKTHVPPPPPSLTSLPIAPTLKRIERAQHEPGPPTSSPSQPATQPPQAPGRAAHSGQVFPGPQRSFTQATERPGKTQTA